MEGVIPAAGLARTERAVMRPDVNEAVLRACRVHDTEIARSGLVFVDEAEHAEDLTHRACTPLRVRCDRAKDEEQSLPILRVALVKPARAKRRRPAVSRRVTPQGPHQRVVHAPGPDGPNTDRGHRLARRRRAPVRNQIASTMGRRLRAVRTHLEPTNTALSTAPGADR